jgi:hypothetical protein
MQCRRSLKYSISRNVIIKKIKTSGSSFFLEYRYLNLFISKKMNLYSKYVIFLMC